MEMEVLTYFAQMCLALRKMHSAGRAHGDSDEAFDTEETPKDVPRSASSEFYFGKGREAPTDVWSLGSIIYHMCAFEPAFQGASKDELMDSTLSSQPARTPKEYSR